MDYHEQNCVNHWKLSASRSASSYLTLQIKFADHISKIIILFSRKNDQKSSLDHILITNDEVFIDMNDI